MNHCYRSIFNRSLGVWQVASEHTRSRSKSGSAKAATCLVVLMSAIPLAPGWAANNLPINGVWLTGNGVSQSYPTELSIGVTTPSAAATAIQWASFDVAQGYTLNISQPTAGSLLLNTVGGAQASSIAGTIQGSALLAVSNVYGLQVQSTGTITGAQAVLLTSLGLTAPPSAILQLNDLSSQAGVSNAGTISASGSVDLSGPTVSNETSGQITANRITLISGSRLIADSTGSSPSAFSIIAPLADTTGAAGTTPKVLNAGTLTATNGSVLLQASTVRTQASLTTPVISNTGTISAQNIALTAQGGSIASSGTLNAASGTVSLQSDMDIRVTGQLSANALTASSTGDLALTGDNQINLLNAIQVGGNLSLSNQRSLVQLGAMQVTGTTAINASSGNLFLTNAGNSFGGAVSLAGHNVLVRSSGALTVARLDAANEASLTAAGALTISGNVDAASLALSADNDTLVTGDVAVTNNVSTSLGILNIGAGGTTGSVRGNIVNNTSVVFNRSDAVTYAGVISGNGAMAKDGAGVLTLNGVNTYGGTTDVRAGTLLVGGTLANASAKLASGVQVRNGARLGGYGTVGTTTIQAGGTLVSGGANGATGPLTIDGDLAMQTGSTLQVGLGAPQNAASALRVTGNASFGGATVRITDAGGYASGLYTLVEYGSLGSFLNPQVSLPVGQATLFDSSADRRIYMSVQGVNPLNYWNANGLAAPGQFGGGSGVWSTTSPVWADINGTTTGAMFPQPGMAVFAGTPGTVTIDSGQGTVQATALQFTSDGYHLVGDVLTLTPGAAPAGPVEVRVGDTGSSSASYTATVDNTLAGVNGLAKTGAGTLVLNGTNTYSGGTWVQGGTLSVSADANLGAAGQAVTLDGGALRITGTSLQALPRAIVLGASGGGLDIADAGNVFRVGDALTGPGSLTKLGTGTLVLTSANNYTGGTSIEAGTLVAGHDGALGSGPVNNAATLVFQNDASAAALAISNNGTVDFSDSGGPAGDDRLSAGSIAGSGRYALGGNTLTVGANNASTEVSGIIADGGLAGGTGAALIKQGTGTLTLSGINTYTGATTVAAGTLSVNGALASATTVLDGATLGGSGMVGSVNVESGGTLAPGNSIGTLRVNGDLTFAPGAVYRVETDAAGNSDRVHVSGTARLNGGVMALPATGNYSTSTRYTILNAAGGFDGTRFSEVSSTLAFLTPTLSYDTNNVTLSLTRNDLGYADVARTRNQRAAATALQLAAGDAAGDMSTALDAINNLSAAQAPAAYDRIGGASLVALRRAGASFSTGLGNQVQSRLNAVGVAASAQSINGMQLAANDRIGDLMPQLAQAGSGKFTLAGGIPVENTQHGFWLRGYGTDQNTDSDGNAAGTRIKEAGISAGFDMRVRDDLVVGAALSHGNADVRTTLEETGKSRGNAAAIYASYSNGPWSVNGNLTLAHNANNMQRRIQVGALDRTANSRFDSKTVAAYGELTYDLPQATWTLQPLAGLALTYSKADGFTETGAGALNLQAEAQGTTSTKTLFGAKALFDLNGISLQPRAIWSHEFGDINKGMSVQLQGSPAATFTTYGVDLPRDALIAGLTIAGKPSERLALFADVQGEFNSKQTNLGLLVGLRASW